MQQNIQQEGLDIRYLYALWTAVAIVSIVYAFYQYSFVWLGVGFFIETLLFLFFLVLNLDNPAELFIVVVAPHFESYGTTILPLLISGGVALYAHSWSPLFYGVLLSYFVFVGVLFWECLRK